MELLLPVCLLLAVISQTTYALTCITDQDCRDIPLGSTGTCLAAVCECLQRYRSTADGCELNIDRPTLGASSSMSEGGNYQLICHSSVVLPPGSTYRFIRNGDVVGESTNNTFTLRDVDEDEEGVYTCQHSFFDDWSQRSLGVNIAVVEAGYRCSRNLECPRNQAYSRVCDLDSQRCECASDYRRKGSGCVPDGALSNMAASMTSVLLALFVFKLL